MSFFPFILQSDSAWNVDLIFLISFLFIGYVLLTGDWLGRLVPGETKVSSKQKACFAIGLLLFLICWASPLYLLSHVIFSIHMLQMSILYFFATPLLILGIPAGILQPFRKFIFFQKVWRFLTRSVIALIMFNGLFILYHIPVVMDEIMTNRMLHTGFYGLLLVSSVWLWWPVVNPIMKNRLQDKQRKKFARANTLVLMPACLLLLSSFVKYDVFVHVQTQMNMFGLCYPHPIDLEDLLQVHYLTPVYDQKLGGLIMMVLHKLSFMVVERTSSYQIRQGKRLEVIVD
ncbi:cytochrome c oxidase assembly protein [Brevibacillus massiliensis]|uniref:cytochrome c oxidase assembly protein n=1 Tax=Brevibacillus massiliensis TaxID=1118054 RepID=UPI0002F6C686|nr:cytochrome c oxidase assembly protein [Brevibacillus massiliensis]